MARRSGRGHRRRQSRTRALAGRSPGKYSWPLGPCRQDEWGDPVGRDARGGRGGFAASRCCCFGGRTGRRHKVTGLLHRFRQQLPTALADITNKVRIAHGLAPEGGFGNSFTLDEGLDLAEEVGVMLGHNATDKVGTFPQSTRFSRTRPSIVESCKIWEASYMENALQRFIRSAVQGSGKSRDFFDKEIQKRALTSGKPLYDIDRGKSTNPSTKTLRMIADVLGQPMDLLQRAVAGELVSPVAQAAPLDMARAPDQPVTRGAYDDVGSVKLRSLNLELAMGEGAAIEDWLEEGEVSFDANWLHAITATPVSQLILGRGIGDSMAPTIGDHDDVLIDLTDNVLNKLDRIWAITIDGAGAIKRLMPAGNGMVEVLSDNPQHPNRVRTYPRESVRIIGRVLWSARRH